MPYRRFASFTKCAFIINEINLLPQQRQQHDANNRCNLKRSFRSPSNVLTSELPLHHRKAFGKLIENRVNQSRTRIPILQIKPAEDIHQNSTTLPCD